MPRPVVALVSMGNLPTQRKTDFTSAFNFRQVHHRPGEKNLNAPALIKPRSFVEPSPVPITGVAPFWQHFAIHHRVTQTNGKPIGEFTLTGRIQGDSKGIAIGMAITIGHPHDDGFRWLIHHGTHIEALFRR